MMLESIVQNQNIGIEHRHSMVSDHSTITTD